MCKRADLCCVRGHVVEADIGRVGGVPDVLKRQHLHTCGVTGGWTRQGEGGGRGSYQPAAVKLVLDRLGEVIVGVVADRLVSGGVSALLLYPGRD